VHIAERLSADTDRPAEPSAKTINWASSGLLQVMLCFASAPGQPCSFSLYAYVQVQKGLGADTDRKGQPWAKTIQRGSSRLRPWAACIATAPVTIVLFQSVQVHNWLGSDTDHPTETSGKTIHGASSWLCSRAACIATVRATLALFQSVHVAEALSAQTDHPAEPRPRHFTGLG